MTVISRRLGIQARTASVRMIELNVRTHLCHFHSFPFAFALLLSKQSGGPPASPSLLFQIAECEEKRAAVTQKNPAWPLLEAMSLARSRSMRPDIPNGRSVQNQDVPPLDEADQTGSAFYKLDPTCLVPTLNRQLSGAESLRSTNDVLQDRPEIEKNLPRSRCVTTSTINGGARHYHVAKNEQHKNHHYTQRKVLSFIPTSIADPFRDHGNKRYRDIDRFQVSHFRPVVMEIEIGGRPEKSLGGQESAAVNQECMGSNASSCSFALSFLIRLFFFSY